MKVVGDAHDEDPKESLMLPKTRDLLTRSWQWQTNLSLFLVLLILGAFVLPSTGVENSNLDDDIAFSVLAVTGSAIAWGSRRLFALTSLVTVVAIGLRWASWWKPTPTLVLWSVSSALAAVLAITVVLFRQVLGPGQVTMMRIRGAIAAYLCIGWSWAHAYHLAALLNRGAFSSTGSDLSHGRTWLNYSLGMLSTAGYGGIVAVTPLAHTLGSAEAVTGQLYLAVLVARLVSMQVSAKLTDGPMS